MKSKIVANSWKGSNKYDHITLEIDGVMTTIITYRHASDTPKFVEQIGKLIERNKQLGALVNTPKQPKSRCKMNLYKSIRFNTLYLVKGREVYFYSVIRKKFMPTTRSVENLKNISVLVCKNFKPNFKHEAFKHVK